MPTAIPPQPTSQPDDVELHALPQTRQFEGMTEWARCFGIDRRKHREYLRAVAEWRRISVTGTAAVRPGAAMQPGRN